MSDYIVLGSNTCYVTTRNGYLDCLQFAHENGCPWTAMTCATAAYGGHLECLQYTHEPSCM